MIYKLQLRRDTEANWMFNNPVLSEAEVGVITDRTPVQLVMGDGHTAFSSLRKYYMPLVESGESIQGFVYIDDLSELSDEVNQFGWCYNGNLYTYVGEGGDTYGGKYQLQGPFGAQGLSAYEVALKNGYVGSEQQWLASLKGETGDEFFKSTIFVRMNNTPTKPTDAQGSWANPAPHVAAGQNSEGTTVYWEDGIPSGTNKIWACTRTFTRTGTGQDAHWSDPQQMSDVEGLYNVEFAKRQPNDAKPADPVPGENGNMHGCVPASNQIWFDPDLDSSEDFTQMYWRAEQWQSNGVISNWLVTFIKGERGDGQSSFKSVIFCRMNNTPTKPTSQQGSWADPSPHVAAGTDSDGNTAYWSDGIPAGTNKIWACSRIFTLDGNTPQEAEWSNPRQMTDVEGVFDVEFAKQQANDDVPPAPTDANRHGGSGTQIWFDPVLDSSEDFTKMFWRAERYYDNGVPGNWTITRIQGEKGDQGPKGDTGDKTAKVMLYKRSATAPPKPSNDSNWPSSTNAYYWFSDGEVTNVPSATGWCMFEDLPAGTDPIWAIMATAYATASASYDAIGRNEWSDPVEMGAVGADGLNSMSLVLYKRSADQPLNFSVATTFNFNTNVLSDGTNNLTPTSGAISGWSRYVPPAGTPKLPLWQISASALSSSLTDSIAANEWSTPAQVGGVDGTDGEKTAVVYLYQRAASAPAKPNASSTYSFTDHALTDDIGNWKRQIPSGSNPLYVVAATAYCQASETTDTIASNEWSDPVVLAENGGPGSPGADGDDGLNSATVFLYQRAASQPSGPNAAMTYNFSNGVINCGGTNYNPTSSTSFAGGWSRTVPSGSAQCWVIQATAIATTASDTIQTSEWSTPAQYVKDGTPGGTGPTGPQGLTYRTSVWGAGINYKNDSANTSAAVRIIDVVTNMEVAFIDDPDFAAFQCRVSHTSHATNAPLPAKGQTNTWWEPYTLSDPLVTPLLLANTIDAKYIKADELIAGAVRTGNANVGTEITDGVFNVKQNGVVRARFGLSGNDLVLQFLDSTGQNVLYEFGPTGINSYVQNTAPGYVQVSLISMPAAAVCPDSTDGQNWTLSSPTTYYMFQDGVVKVGNNTTYYVQNQSEGLTSHSPYHGKLFTSNPSNPANASLISDGTYIQNVTISSSPIISGTSNKKIVYDRSTGPLINTTGWQSLGWYWHQANKVTYSGGVPGAQVSFLFRRTESGSEISRGPSVIYSVSVITRVNNMANIESEAQDYRN